MNKFFVYIQYSLLLAIINGCMLAPQAITLRPIIKILPSLIGNHQSLTLSIIDERPTKTLGLRGGDRVAEITIFGDLAQAVRNALKKELISRNFIIPNKTSNQSKELRIEFRSLNYKIESGVFSSVLKIDTAIKGICKSKGLNIYEKIYRSESRKNVQAVQTSNNNSKIVNIVVSNVINQLLADMNMLKCLSKKNL